MRVKPALLSRRAYEGGARNAKQFVLDGPHLDAPPSVRVPSRFPTTMSPRSSPRIEDEKKLAPPSEEATIAMSPTQAIETALGFASAPPTSTAGTRTATSAATARTRVTGRC